MLAGALFHDQKIPDVFREPDPLVVRNNLAPLFYFYGSSVYQPYFQGSAAQVMKRDYYLSEITERLNAEKISFRLLKGSLTADCYPAKALRPSCDIDILIRQEDIETALNLFRNDGWRLSHPYLNAPGKHLPTLRKQEAALELHLALFGGGASENKILWERLDQGASEYDLAFLHLIYHCIIAHHFSNRWQMLVDLAVLLKSGLVNAERIAQWEQSITGENSWSSMVLNSFPEFFPETFRRKFPVTDPALSQAIRRLFWTENQTSDAEDSIWCYRNSNRHEKIVFLKKQFSKRTPAFIGARYQLSPQWSFCWYPFFCSWDLLRCAWSMSGVYFKRNSESYMKQGAARQKILRVLNKRCFE